MRAWLLAMLLLAAGCAEIKPWERGRLTHACMQIPVDAVEAAQHGHFESEREGSSGGASRGGGGCGCN